MTAEPLLGRGLDGIDHLVVSSAHHLDVTAVVWAILGDHRHELPFLFSAGVQVRQFVGNRQVRYPLACAEAVRIPLERMDVRLQVDIRLGCGQI